MLHDAETFWYIKARTLDVLRTAFTFVGSNAPQSPIAMMRDSQAINKSLKSVVFPTHRDFFQAGIVALAVIAALVALSTKHLENGVQQAALVQAPDADFRTTEEYCTSDEPIEFDDDDSDDVSSFTEEYCTADKPIGFDDVDNDDVSSIDTSEAKLRRRRQAEHESCLLRFALLEPPPGSKQELERMSIITEIQDRFAATKRPIRHKIENLPPSFTNRAFYRLAGKPTTLSSNEMFYYNPHCGTSMIYHRGPTHRKRPPYEAVISEKLSQAGSRHFPVHFETDQVSRVWFWTS